MIVPVLDALESGDAVDTPQDDRQAVYASKLERADSRIDWAAPATAIHNRIRGLHPWPLASTTLAPGPSGVEARRVLVIRSALADQGHSDAPPGTIVSADATGLCVETGAGQLRLLELQPEGRRAMPVRDFLNGTRVTAGDRFE